MVRPIEVYGLCVVLQVVLTVLGGVIVEGVARFWCIARSFAAPHAGALAEIGIRCGIVGDARPRPGYFTRV